MTGVADPHTKISTASAVVRGRGGSRGNRPPWALSFPLLAGPAQPGSAIFYTVVTWRQARQQRRRQRVQASLDYKRDSRARRRLPHQTASLSQRRRYGDTYADLGATVSDTGSGQAADTNVGIKTFLNGTLVSNIIIDTSEVATDTIDYVATDSAGLTATSTRTILIEPVAPSAAATTTTTTATN